MADSGSNSDRPDNLRDFLKDLSLPDGLDIITDDLTLETVAPVDEDEPDSPKEISVEDQDSEPGPEINGINADVGLYGPNFPQIIPVGDPDKLQRMIIRIEEGFKKGDRLEITDLDLVTSETETRIAGLDIMIHGGGFDDNTRSLCLTGLATAEDYDLVVSHVSLSSIDQDSTNGKRILRITATDGTGANWDAPLLILDIGI